MFQSADPYKIPPRSLATSLTLHSLGLAILCWAGLPSSPLRPRKFHTVLLAPVKELPPVQTRQIPAPKLSKPVAPLRYAVLAPRKLSAPVLEPPTPAPTLLADTPPAPLHVEPIAIAPPVKLGTFASAAPEKTIATPALTLPEARLKNAGFDAAQASAPSGPSVRTLAAGSFDTVAAGKGDRRPGTLHGASGFGDAKAVEAGGAPRSTVLAANFGDTTVAGPERRAAASSTPAIVPVEILDKPRPAYTDEARRLNIQGEVLLEVAFDASGAVRVLAVIRGLGHGLEETAMAAARQIHFRPARRDGQPVDSTAVVHIVFQLAN